MLPAGMCNSPLRADAPADLTVRTLDYSGVDAATLNRAQNSAGAALRQAGIRVQWLNCSAAIPGPSTMDACDVRLSEPHQPGTRDSAQAHGRDNFQVTTVPSFGFTEKGRAASSGCPEVALERKRCQTVRRRQVYTDCEPETENGNFGASVTTVNALGGIEVTSGSEEPSRQHIPPAGSRSGRPKQICGHREVGEQCEVEHRHRRHEHRQPVLCRAGRMSGAFTRTMYLMIERRNLSVRTIPG